jgi:hypothetical protein
MRLFLFVTIPIVSLSTFLQVCLSESVPGWKNAEVKVVLVPHVELIHERRLVVSRSADLMIILKPLSDHIPALSWNLLIMGVILYFIHALHNTLPFFVTDVLVLRLQDGFVYNHAWVVVLLGFTDSGHEVGFTLT